MKKWKTSGRERKDTAATVQESAAEQFLCLLLFAGGVQAISLASLLNVQL